MNDTPAWHRAGAATGALGAVVYLASAFWAGAPLKPDAPIHQVVSHLTERRRGVLVGFALATIAVALLVWFAGHLREILASEGGSAPLANVTLASWLVLLITALGGAVPLAAVVWRGAGQVDRGLVQLAFDASNLSLYSLGATAALLSVLAPTIVVWRSGLLPRWLVALGVVEIVVNLVELVGAVTLTGFNAAGYAAGVGPFLWALWVAAISVAMVVRDRVASAQINTPPSGTAAGTRASK